MEQLTGSKLGEEYAKAVYCHLAYLSYMQSTSCKMLGWMNHKVESGLVAEVSTLSDKLYDITLKMAESEEELRVLLMRLKEESEKAGLQLSIKKKLRSWHLVTSLHGKSKEAVTDLFFGSQITADGECSHEIVRHCSSLKGKL